MYDRKGSKLLKNRRNPAQGGCYKKSKLAPCSVKNGGFLRVLWCCCVNEFFIIVKIFIYRNFSKKFQIFFFESYKHMMCRICYFSNMCKNAQNSVFGWVLGRKFTKIALFCAKNRKKWRISAVFALFFGCKKRIPLP